MKSISVFLDIAKFADFRWKMLMPAELKGCVTWFISFLDLLWVRYICAKFHHCRMCVTDFREGGHFCPNPPICKQPRKSPSWIGLKTKQSFDCFYYRIRNFCDQKVYKSKNSYLANSGKFMFLNFLQKFALFNYIWTVTFWRVTPIL